MKINDIINFNDYTVIWEEVWKIKEFKTLLTTEQNKIWHAEGVVANHIKMVVEAMYSLIPLSNNNQTHRLIMILSALFHDIGKGNTTFFSTEKNDWSSPMHDLVGESITRYMLRDEEELIRESVCYFVRNHMKPLYVSDSPVKLRSIIALSCVDNTLHSCCNNENLIILKTADCKGSIMTENDNWEEKLEYAIMLCKEQNCYDKQYPFKNEISKYHYLNISTDEYPLEINNL